MSGTPGRRRWLVALQIVVTLGLLGWLVHVFGVRAAATAGLVLTPTTIAASLALGLVATYAQAMRWRSVAAGWGDRMSRRHALARYLEAAFLNAVLPGGVAGDAVRAVRRGRDTTAWGASVGSVVGERLCGTTVVLAAASVALGSFGRGDLAATLGVLTVCVGAGAAWSLRRLTVRTVLEALAWSLLGWGCFVALFVVAATALSTRAAAPALSPSAALAFGSAVLGGMSIPLNVGGWGPRETVAAVVSPMAGLDPATGFTASVAYGLLATISTLPGAVVLMGAARARYTRPHPTSADGTDPAAPPPGRRGPRTADRAPRRR